MVKEKKFGRDSGVFDIVDVGKIIDVVKKKDLCPGGGHVLLGLPRLFFFDISFLFVVVEKFFVIQFPRWVSEPRGGYVYPRRVITGLVVLIFFGVFGSWKVVESWGRAWPFPCKADLKRFSRTCHYCHSVCVTSDLGFSVLFTVLAFRFLAGDG